MAELRFRDLSFEEEPDFIRVSLYRLFYFRIPVSEINRIGKFKIEKNSIKFAGITEETVSRKFNILISKNIRNLKSKLNNLPAVYIHQNSGIPLIGSVYFGLVDRDTNVIEIKPMTGCNFNCTYCSVDEGRTTRKQAGYVVEEEYIVREFKRLAEYKRCEEIEAHIAGQCEPLLYERLADLIEDVSRIRAVKTISIDTNGSLLDEKKIDELAGKGLTRINLSINALDKNIASEMAGTIYDVEKIERVVAYASGKVDVVIAPVWLPGINDSEIPKMIEFVKQLQGKTDRKVIIGIQNFLNYSFGRNPVKGKPFELFYKELKKLEKEHGITLISPPDLFKFIKTKPLEKPFIKGDIVKAEIKLPGRRKGEMLAVSGGRVISIAGCRKGPGIVNVRIIKTKDNIFSGELV
ncbi:radical SAM protein [Candidatus Woesearchaeota archaeon]|nr:radical SAM protein [Candidatus Woesearchaeota archaeon]